MPRGSLAKDERSTIEPFEAIPTSVVYIAATERVFTPARELKGRTEREVTESQAFHAPAPPPPRQSAPPPGRATSVPARALPVDRSRPRQR